MIHFYLQQDAETERNTIKKNQIEEVHTLEYNKQNHIKLICLQKNANPGKGT